MTQEITAVCIECLTLMEEYNDYNYVCKKCHNVFNKEYIHNMYKSKNKLEDEYLKASDIDRIHNISHAHAANNYELIKIILTDLHLIKIKLGIKE